MNSLIADISSEIQVYYRYKKTPNLMCKIFQIWCYFYCW